MDSLFITKKIIAMKKITLLSILFVGMAFVSCEKENLLSEPKQEAAQTRVTQGEVRWSESGFYDQLTRGQYNYFEVEEYNGYFWMLSFLETSKLFALDGADQYIIINHEPGWMDQRFYVTADAPLGRTFTLRYDGPVTSNLTVHIAR